MAALIRFKSKQGQEGGNRETEYRWIDRERERVRDR